MAKDVAKRNHHNDPIANHSTSVTKIASRHELALQSLKWSPKLDCESHCESQLIPVLEVQTFTREALLSAVV